MVVRGFEWRGQAASAQLGFGGEINAAKRTDLAGRGGQPLPSGGGVVHVQITPNSVETARVMPTSGAADLAAPAVGDDTSELFCRWWLHNNGAAPLGNIPVSVALRGELIPGCTSTVTAVVANNLSDAEVSLELVIDAPDGCGISLDKAPVQLAAHEGRSVDILVDVPGDAKGFLCASIVNDGVKYTDVLWVEPTEFQVAVSVSSDDRQVTVELVNLITQDLAVETTLVSPIETWSEMSLGARRFVDFNKHVTVEAGGKQKTQFAATQMVTDGWVWIKVATSGLCRYFQAPVTRKREVSNGEWASFADIDIAVNIAAHNGDKCGVTADRSTQPPNNATPSPTPGVNSYWTVTWNRSVTALNVEVGVIPASLADTSDPKTAKLLLLTGSKWEELQSEMDLDRWVITADLPSEILARGLAVISLKGDTPTNWLLRGPARNFTGEPLVVDLLGDGEISTVVATRDKRVAAIDADGRARWSRRVRGWSWPSPEIVAGV